MKIYRITFDRWAMQAVGFNEQDALDRLVDLLESEGKLGLFYEWDEIEKEKIPDDEYVVAGNHSLPLIHHGNFSIEYIGEVED